MLDKLTQLNTFLERLKSLVQQWDYHVTTCKACAEWDKEHKDKPCEIGFALMHEILDMLE